MVGRPISPSAASMLVGDAERLRQRPLPRPVLFEDTDRPGRANNAARWLAR
jgi:hypothetical protein